MTKKKTSKRRRRLIADKAARKTMLQPSPGVVLDERYKLLEELGRGGMGIVFKAHDIELDIDVAVKVLPPELAYSERAVSDLKREAVLAMKLRHPGIAALYHFAYQDDIKFLVMELLEGMTLDEYLTTEGLLTVDEMILLCRDVAGPIDYAHSERIVHRDIKPGNIFLHRKDDRGSVRIMDFGIARQMQDSLARVSRRDVSGTLLYMSPEQLQGKAVSPSSDIYSLAATLYECVAGNPPFCRGSISYQIINTPPEPIDEAPPHVNAVLLKALAKKPDDRFSSVARMAAALAGEDQILVLPGERQSPAPGDSTELGRAGAVAVVSGSTGVDTSGSGASGSDASGSDASGSGASGSDTSGSGVGSTTTSSSPSSSSSSSSGAAGPGVITLSNKNGKTGKDSARPHGCLRNVFSCVFSSFLLVGLVAGFVVFVLLAFNYVFPNKPQPKRGNNEPLQAWQPRRSSRAEPARFLAPSRPHRNAVRTNPWMRRPSVRRPVNNNRHSASQVKKTAMVYIPPRRSAQDLLERAVSRAMNSDYDAALREARRLVSEYPSSSDRLEDLYDVLIKRKAFACARELLAMTGGKSRDPALWTRGGIAAFEEKNLAEAARFFTKAQSLDPDAHEAFFHLALICEGKGQGGKALEYVKRALQVCPGNPEYLELFERLSMGTIPLPAGPVAPSSRNAGHGAAGRSMEQSSRPLERKTLVVTIRARRDSMVRITAMYLSLVPEDPGTGPVIERELSYVRPKKRKRRLRRVYRTRVQIQPGRYRLTVRAERLGGAITKSRMPDFEKSLGFVEVDEREVQSCVFRVEVPWIDEGGND